MISDPQAGRAEWHRTFAIEAFNRSWDLLEELDRGPAGDDEMLAVAFASRWHWGHVGDAENRAIGDHQIAKVAAELGLGKMAQRYAARALAVADGEGWKGWRAASVREGMARAAHAAGDSAQRDRWLAAAKEALATEDDPEDREVILDQLRQIPGWTD
ncbi:MAG TPA: hypothetical protein VMZ00_04300 [Sporichthya sp.]|nr:hypothetical protein [Sporichthya sp.]